MAEAIKVVCGANTQEMEGLEGKTVAEVKEGFREVLNIPDGARAIVSGDNVENVYVLRAGDVLEFVKPSGKKG
jgi:hypothetical protein